MKRLALIGLAFVATQACASGDWGPSYTRFKAYTAPDMPLERFQQGELGVLQPGMQRVYLYTAWRALTLGARARENPGTAGGLARADGAAFGYGWETSGEQTPLKEEWLRETRLPESLFGACPPAANTFAMQTFRALGKRKDATAARVKAWSDAQEQVSNVCKVEQDARYGDGSALARLAMPAALPDTEPAYWRQLRDYQRAAAHFHGERHAEATALFEQIAGTADHPMRDLGRYLALRSEVRRAVKLTAKADDAARQAAYAALEERTLTILADASLAPRHEAARATLRSARAHLTPHGMYADLNRYLADPAADPFIDDRLGDWMAVQRLAEEQLQTHAAIVRTARSKYDFIDWIETLRECGYPGQGDASCRPSAERAMAQWQRSGARPWLAAVLITAAGLTPALEKAALAVKSGEPDYLTARYHLARLYRLAGRSGDARAVSDAALKLDMPHGSRNLFREERFAVATSVADAAAFMLRVDVDSTRGNDKAVESLNDDALDWLINGLGSTDMVELARQDKLDANIRARLASGAWMRAELLGKHDVALQALGVLEPLAPALQKDIAVYRAAKAPAERRHLMLLTALRFGLSPQMSETSTPVKEIGKDEVAASNWCSFKPGAIVDTGPKAFPWLLPPRPAVGDKARAGEELGRLAALKSATGYIGDHVMARLKTHPRDPDLPWLLHVVVASTRGGCLDADAKQLSRAAFGALHKRYPGDEWTKKTPYFY